MYEAIVIGASAGGMFALKKLLSSLPADFRIPIIIVQHIAANSENYIVEFLDNSTKLKVKEVDEKEKISKGFVYICPPNYHLMVEHDHTLSLSADEKVNYSRPSIDVLFYTAADSFKSKLIGIVLTGANDDGSRGLLAIKKNNGLIIVQDPLDAETPTMPTNAINSTKPKYILAIEGISKLLIELQ